MLAALVITACSDSGGTTAPTATPPPVITPPAELSLTRARPACFTRQDPAAGIPGVRGYRLAETRELPPGLAPTVKAVHFAGVGDARVLESEICFTADQSTPDGRYETHLELQLFSVDSEKLAGNSRLTPVRTLPFTQVVVVQ
jgi:hypothetical protein